MQATLANLVVGATAKVIALSTDNKTYRRKLLSMGLTPGTEFKVTRVAPMGDPVEINVRGFALSLRKGEAQAILTQDV
tara:strand:+ start:2352 stop:2585 length:234 start_codon:yes stop_codon:yes gene_type:complete